MRNALSHSKDAAHVVGECRGLELVAAAHRVRSREARMHVREHVADRDGCAAQPGRRRWRAISSPDRVLD